MKSAILILLMITFFNLKAQDFGCFNLPQIADNENDKVFSPSYSEKFVFSFIHDFDWAAYAPKNCEDGWYSDYSPMGSVYFMY